MSTSDRGDARPGVAKTLFRLAIATGAEAAIVVGHFLYGARLYDDAYRAHPVEPVLAAFGVVVLLAVAFWRTEKSAVLWLLSAAVGVPFVVVFGGYHGGFSHALKLVVFAAGAPPERLEAIFDSPDYALPNDFAFEASGVLCLASAVVVASYLAKLLRITAHGRKPVQTPVLQDA
jgi:hypothetical protein